MPIEIYWNESRTMLIAEQIDKGETTRFDMLDAETIQHIDSVVAVSKPNVYKALCEEFGYGPQFAYARVYQFSACNFSTQDGHADIDLDFNITPERVPCPIRHKCKDIYCTNEILLSNREVEIVKLFARNMDEETIADTLFISKATVHNHINNIYRKLGFSGHRFPDRLLITYAFTNKLI